MSKEAYKKMMKELNEDKLRVKGKVEVITLEMARYLLDHNKMNRPSRRKEIKKLRADIRNNQWKITGQGVIISDKGNLLNGQHTLIAFIEEKVELPVFVIRGVRESSFTKIDIGAKRTGKDAVCIHFNIKPRVGNILSTSVTWWRKYVRGSFLLAQDKGLTNTTLVEEVEKTPAFLEAAEFIAKEIPRSKNLISHGVGAFLYYVFSTVGGEQKAKMFLKKFYLGTDLPEYNPILVARHLLEKDALAQKKMHIGRKVFIVIKAWNYLRKGTRVIKNSACLVPRSDSAIWVKVE